MNLTKLVVKRTALATAVATTLGMAAIPEQASAVAQTFSYTGWFTMLNPPGTGALNNGDAGGPPMYGNRTAVAGTMTFDTAAGTGTATMGAFSFFGGGPATATNITFQSIGSDLILGNLGFNWGGNEGIPVSIVQDAKGMFDAIGMSPGIGDSIGATGADFACGTNIACSDAATEDFLFGAKASYTLPIGASPVVTTTFDTTDIGTVTLGTNPSGTLPLVADTIGGSPMKAGPFPLFNANFDFTDMRLLNDGISGDITDPGDILAKVNEDILPPTWPVPLGTPTDVDPAGSAEYCAAPPALDIDDCLDNGPWTADDNADNTIDVTLTGPITTVDVTWRSQAAGVTKALDIQKVTAKQVESVPPDITATPNDFTHDVVVTTTETICFSGTSTPHGVLTATDNSGVDPIIEYSLTGFDFVSVDDPDVENCSPFIDANGNTVFFGPGENTVFWQARDDSGNISKYEQTVTLIDLPPGIIGKDCEINLDWGINNPAPNGVIPEGFRELAGSFIMRNPLGSQTGTTDNTVTGKIDTTLLCTEQGTDVCPDVGAVLETAQAFEGLFWTAEPVWLYGPGDWTFEACPGDNSAKCDGNPRPVSMRVLDAASNGGIPQLGAHMLFEWGSTQDIDVVVVWDVDCGSKQLTTTDPATPPNSTHPGGLPPDGILGSPMVDGPFIGFNAAFDQNATGVDADGNSVPLIADGGFTVTTAAYQNPIAGGSPPPAENVELDEGDLDNDPGAIKGCVGGCNRFKNVPTSVDVTDEDNDPDIDYKQAYVVLPLRDGEVIPFWSKYRKFKDNEWQDFVVNNRNSVQSALRNADGSCPEPGSGDYKVAAFNSQMENKLELGDGCIQLCIEDNGPNDTDANVVGFVSDDSGVAQVAGPAAPEATTTGSEGCSLSTTTIDPAKRADWTLMGGMLTVLGFFSLRRRRKQRH